MYQARHFCGAPIYLYVQTKIGRYKNRPNFYHHATDRNYETFIGCNVAILYLFFLQRRQNISAIQMWMSQQDGQVDIFGGLIPHTPIQELVKFIPGAYEQ